MKAFVKNAANRSFAVLLLAVCSHMTPALAEPLACDDGIKTAFHPDVDTTVVAVRLVKKGEELAGAGRAQAHGRRPPICAW